MKEGRQKLVRKQLFVSLTLSSLLTGREAFVNSYELITQIEG